VRKEINTDNIRRTYKLLKNGSKKCDYHSRLREKPVKGGEGWIV